MLLACAAAPALALADGKPSLSAASTGNLGDRVLAVGMHGEDVRDLQRLLTERGFGVDADGQFGPMTLAAVKAAQSAYGLTVDGVVGPITLGALQAGKPTTSSGNGRYRCSSKPGSGDSVSRWRPVVKCVLKMLHQKRSKRNVNDVLTVIRYESGGNPRARNGWDINAQNGDPSRGLMQTIGATFRAYRSSQLSKSIYDPAANIYAGIHYALERYGSIRSIPGVKSLHAGRGYLPYKQLTR